MLLRIPGFPAGIHTDSMGMSQQFAAERLQACATSYDVRLHEAPVVIGHPDEQQEMPQAWVKSVVYEERLTAYADKLSDLMWGMLQNNQARKYSFSFYLENHPRNPVPGTLYLRHVGIVTIPAIKDNPEPELTFSESEQTVTLNFCEHEECLMGNQETQTPAQQVKQETAEFIELAESLTKKEQALAQKEAALKQKEHELAVAAEANFVEGLIIGGKVLPRDQADLVNYLAAQAMSFAEGDNTNKDWFKGFLLRLPKQVEFSEVSKPDSETPRGDDAELKRMAENMAKGANR
jgi:hypothetical protein